jgi:hypothetical protein
MQELSMMTLQRTTENNLPTLKCNKIVKTTLLPKEGESSCSSTLKTKFGYDNLVRSIAATSSPLQNQQCIFFCYHDAKLAEAAEIK